MHLQWWILVDYMSILSHLVIAADLGPSIILSPHYYPWQKKLNPLSDEHQGLMYVVVFNDWWDLIQHMLTCPAIRLIFFSALDLLVIPLCSPLAPFLLFTTTTCLLLTLQILSPPTTFILNHSFVDHFCLPHANMSPCVWMQSRLALSQSPLWSCASHA